ncbi:hypothetical protein NE237_012593 [Protea cynaroides]|uniref:C2H2-type domain-containing protein n=1 Tax=Protea cynaroides TaxID=273540 RepID=A0A9Q0H0G0_9MAGN|nr:hypothetical protein NE237_012593 [Protea cynaroides]
MAGLSLRCRDCGALLKSVEEAQEHAELTSHSNFAKSTEAVLNLVCNSCSNPCQSRIADLLLSYFRFSPSAKLDSEMEETGESPRCRSEGLVTEYLVATFGDYFTDVKLRGLPFARKRVDGAEPEQAVVDPPNGTSSISRSGVSSEGSRGRDTRDQNSC